MKAKARKSCPNCRRLEARLAALEATVALLQEQLAAARKDSSTSSKPPSSDIVKPPKPPPPEGQDRRHIGGQPGHPKHERAAFPPEAINGASVDYRLDLCPCCGHGLQPMPTIVPRVIQQVDIKDVPLKIQEHRGHPGWCSHCQKQFEAPLAHRHRTRRLGRSQADHRDRLPQGSLPRFVLHHPQVRPRRCPGDHLAWATGEDHRQGESCAGAAL